MRPPESRSIARAVAALLAVLVVAIASGTPGAVAQAAEGRVTGQIVLRTAGETFDDSLSVDLIVLRQESVTGTVTAAVDAEGRFTAEVPLDAASRYIPRVTYQGVGYFGQPVAVTQEQPTADVGPVEVYATTSTPPDLAIRETVMTAVALDRAAGEIGFIREDLVVNPSDRVYVGGEDRITLRIPAPEGTLDAAGENADGRFALAEGVLTTTVPIRAEGETGIVTRYLVQYERVDDRYTLRATVPMAAERVVVRIPEGYARDLRIEGAGQFGDDEFIEVEGRDPVRLRTVVLEDAHPGDSLVVVLDGMEPQVNRNPLTETPGSIIAGLVALLAVGGASAAVIARGRRRSTDEGDGAT